MMTPQEFASQIRSKYPGSYDSLDDNTLTQKIIDKYPQYKEQVTQDEGPGMIKSAAAGVMSGVPGAETAISGIGSLVGDKSYEDIHKSLENLKDKAWETHPVAYGAGKTAGIVGTGAVAPEVLGGLGVENAIGQAAIQGAGYGADVANKPSDIPNEALKGGAVGGALGTIGEKVISPIVSKLPGAAKSTLAALGSQTTPEDIQSYLDNPDAINNALSKPQVGQKIADTASDISTASKQLSEKARGLLNPENVPVNMKDLENVFQETAAPYYRNGEIKTGMEPAVKALEDEFIRIHGMAAQSGGAINENLLRGIIDDLQQAPKMGQAFGTPDVAAKQEALKTLSGKLNGVLQNSNPEYAEQMAPSAEMAQLSKATKEGFGLESNSEGKLAPTNTTGTKINNALNENKPEGAALMERIQGATGQDLQNILNQAQTKENFAAPGAGGALRALLPALGYGVGRTTGIPFGGLAGAAVGHFTSGAIDGGQIAKGILDAYIGGGSAVPDAMKGALQKFGPMLVNAAKTGGNNLAATHFVLATSNPDYQGLVEHMQNQGNQ